MWNSSDLVLPPIATIPVTLPWNIILLIIYIPAFFILYLLTSARKAHNFSEGGWTALFILRSAQGLIGIIIPLISKNSPSAQDVLSEGLSTNIPCSLLHDLGTVCLILGLTRALFHALSIQSHEKFLNILRRLWGFSLVLLPIPGYLFASFVIQFRFATEQENEHYDSKRVNGYSAIAYSILRASTISLGATLLAMAPFFLFVLMKRQKGQVWASCTATATATTFFPTLILMSVCLVNGILRFSANHQPTVVQQFALGLAPEIIVTIIWLVLAHHIGECDKTLLARQNEIRIHKAQEWEDEIMKASEDTRAFGLADTPQEAERKKLFPDEQREENVYSCARYRLQRLYEHFNQHGKTVSRDFDDEERLLVRDAKENARLVAGCLILSPCEDHPLFGGKLSPAVNGQGMRPQFSSSKTTKLVLEAMRKQEAMKALKNEELEWAVGDIVKIHLA